MVDNNLNEKQVIDILQSINQSHIVQQIPNFSEQERAAFVKQVNKINTNYPGGIQTYYKNAIQLLKDSKNLVNPLDGFVPSVPVGETIDFYNTNQINNLESIGVKELEDCVFMLIAGGLGERLGYGSGIKLSLPLELTTNQTFLEYYVKYILAFERRGTKKIPFCLFVSEDVYQRTVDLFEQNNYFGMPKEQITILNQGNDSLAVINNEAHFSLVKGKLLLETKPHGHGDVHIYVYNNQLTHKWKQMGKKWIIFFQDTNPLVFRSYPAVLGVSKSKNLEVNTITVPRKPGETVGSICQLTHKDGRVITNNVEYNQLDALLKASVGTEGTDQHGNSIYPGNTNSIIFSLEDYHENLMQTQGSVFEFVNPKYSDSTRSFFKSSTRLECMFQDYPKTLKNAQRVGFTQVNRGFCFSTVKNSLVAAQQKQQAGLALESAPSCENDFYILNANILRLAGQAQIDENTNVLNFQNINLAFQPRIVLDPDFGVTLKEIQGKIQGQIQVTGESTLVIKGSPALGNVSVDGVLVVQGEQFMNTNNKDPQNYKVEDKKYKKFVSIDLNQQNLQEHYKVRGYDLQYIQ